MAKILLAEDDDSLRTFLANALVKAGHDVSDYPDGDQAFDALQAVNYDLLLTDETSRYVSETVFSAYFTNG